MDEFILNLEKHVMSAFMVQLALPDHWPTLTAKASQVSGSLIIFDKRKCNHPLNSETV
jgi:hypothetical protein